MLESLGSKLSAVESVNDIVLIVIIITKVSESIVLLYGTLLQVVTFVMIIFRSFTVCVVMPLHDIAVCICLCTLL